MPQAIRRTYRWAAFEMPVSYKVNAQNRMKDARNVFTNQGLLETRHGTSRFNDTAIATGNVLSATHFKNNSGVLHTLAKVGTSIFKVPETGASTNLKSSLSAATKHRAVSFNGRHIIAIEGDGLYSYDGTTFTQLGQLPPTAGSEALSSGGALVDTNTYQVGLTFYSSTIGFETNVFGLDQSVTASPNLQIDVSAIPSIADNALIDKVRLYLKDVTAGGDYLFYAEINLGTTTHTVDSIPTSTSTPPITHALPLAGGGKYVAVFGQKIAYTGNSNFPSDTFISEAYLPDAFDDTGTSGVVLQSAGNGPNTGLAVGFYNQDNLNPYLCIFKRNSIEIYSELGGIGSQSPISSEIGCVSNDTIKVVGGNVYFLSTKGWHVISNGKLISSQNGDVASLGKGDINDIFTRSGYTYELNKSNYENFFSVYYPTFDHYMTFISEGASSDIYKCYNYESQIGGFRPYDFPTKMFCGTLAEDGTGEDIVLLGGENGFIYKHSVKEARSDILLDNSTFAIDVFALLYWIAGDDMDATLNFGIFTLRALESDNMLTVKYFLDYEITDPSDNDFDFSKDATGFILDVSKLDEGVLGDGRTIVLSKGGVYRTSQSLLIGFYQNILDANIGLIEGQLDASKNGSPN